MGINLKAGEKIPLFLLTENRVTDRVVRARIRNELGAEISGSPKSVPHLSDGEYFDDTVLMPDTKSIIVAYDVFDGPGFTNLSQDLLPIDERFDLDELATAIDQLKTASRQADLTAKVNDTNTLKATITDDDEITAAVRDDDELKATVKDQDELKAKVDNDNELTGSVDC